MLHKVRYLEEKSTLSYVTNVALDCSILSCDISSDVSWIA